MNMNETYAKLESLFSNKKILVSFHEIFDEFDDCLWV